EQPEHQPIGSVAGDHAQSRRKQHIDGRGEGVDPFAHGIDQAVARREVLADAVGDIIILPRVVGVGREGQGNCEDSGKDQPASASISTRGKWESAQTAHTSGGVWLTTPRIARTIMWLLLSLVLPAYLPRPGRGAPDVLAWCSGYGWRVRAC